jgi:hypothetical protein
VLIHSGAKPGASSSPALTELASSPGDRLTSRPAQRRAAAAAAAVTAATASATTEPADASGGGSASSAHNHTVNSPRTVPARAANRASQSRTVDAGLPRPSAIGRNPMPSAFAARAAQITTTPSARRSRQLTGSSTCVTPQPPHRDLRGRSRQPIPPAPRTTRWRACPHPASTPEHAGQRNRPAASRRSTTRPSAPTVTIGASAHLARPSRHLGQEKDGRAAANPDLITVASHTKKDNPAGLPSQPSSPQTTSARHYVLTPKVAGHLRAQGPDRKFCSPECKMRYHNSQRAARPRPQRLCACGAPSANRAGRAVCAACRVDERSRPYRREYILEYTLRQYGLTKADYDQMLAAQHGRCAICCSDTPQGRGRWHIDHDHVTGQVRGLLCNNCNRGIGYFGEDPEVMTAAARYVARHRQLELPATADVTERG